MMIEGEDEVFENNTQQRVRNDHHLRSLCSTVVNWIAFLVWLLVHFVACSMVIVNNSEEGDEVQTDERIVVSIGRQFQATIVLFDRSAQSPRIIPSNPKDTLYVMSTGESTGDEVPPPQHNDYHQQQMHQQRLRMVSPSPESLLSIQSRDRIVTQSNRRSLDMDSTDEIIRKRDKEDTSFDNGNRNVTARLTGNSGLLFQNRKFPAVAPLQSTHKLSSKIGSRGLTVIRSSSRTKEKTSSHKSTSGNTMLDKASIQGTGFIPVGRLDDDKSHLSELSTSDAVMEDNTDTKVTYYPDGNLRPNEDSKQSAQTKRIENRPVSLPLVDSRPQLVVPEDKGLVSEPTYFIFEQMTICTFTKADQYNGRHKNHPLGFPGIACKYCYGQKEGSGRFFYDSIAFLYRSRTDQKLINHLTKYKLCPIDIRKKIQIMKVTHYAPDGQFHRSKKRTEFMERIWSRLHNIPQDNIPTHLKVASKKRKRTACEPNKKPNTKRAKADDYGSIGAEDEPNVSCKSPCVSEDSDDSYWSDDDYEDEEICSVSGTDDYDVNVKMPPEA